MKVLGIDPGTLNLGWGFIESKDGKKWQKVEHGSLHVPQKMPFYERLLSLDEQLSEVVRKIQPDFAVIEKIFLGKSVDSAFKLGHIRGICAARCQASGAEIVEYTPRTVKLQITGSGGADKAVVRQFLYQQLGLRDSAASLDATDALALAFCHFLHHSMKAKHRGMTLR